MVKIILKKFQNILELKFQNVFDMLSFKIEIIFQYIYLIKQI